MSQILFQAVKLFLYLLRYREIEQTFLVYDNNQNRQSFEKTVHCLEIAQNSFQNARDFTKAAKTADLKEGIKKYMYFEGSPDIVEIMNELAE
jgi:hypothetical protein